MGAAKAAFCWGQFVIPEAKARQCQGWGHPGPHVHCGGRWGGAGSERPGWGQLSRPLWSESRAAQAAGLRQAAGVNEGKAQMGPEVPEPWPSAA